MDSKKLEDTKFYLQILSSNTCVCESWKQEDKAVCYVCFHKLPDDMQSDLYKRLGNGFEEAYEEVIQWLISEGHLEV